jgi:hypothetical protein
MHAESMQATPDSPVRDAKKKSPIEQARIIIVRRIWAAITAKPVPRQIRDAGWGTGRNYYLDDIDIDIYT